MASTAVVPCAFTLVPCAFTLVPCAFTLVPSQGSNKSAPNQRQFAVPPSRVKFKAWCLFTVLYCCGYRASLGFTFCTGDQCKQSILLMLDAKKPPYVEEE